MSRGDLTDSEWRILDPLLPNRGERGPAIADKRRTVNGILWVLRTSAPSRDMPERRVVGFLERPTMVSRTSDWRDELGRWLKPFLDRLGHNVRLDSDLGAGDAEALFRGLACPRDRRHLDRRVAAGGGRTLWGQPQCGGAFGPAL